MYHDLKFSEKEEHNTQKENEEYLRGVKKETMTDQTTMGNTRSTQ